MSHSPGRSEPLSAVGAGHTAAKDNRVGTSSQQKLFADIVRGGTWVPSGKDEEWKMVQRRKLRNRFSSNRGKADTGVNGSFKAADIKATLYISNVAKDVGVCDISKYIASKTNVQFAIEKINMKFQKPYDAYKVFVPQHSLEVFLCDDFWPCGVAYRRFINFRPKVQGKQSDLLKGNCSPKNYG